MLEIAGEKAKSMAMIDDFRIHNRKLIPGFQLFEGVIEQIKMLREAGLKTGIVTSKNQGSTFITIESHQLASHFDIVLTKDDTSLHKPHPEPLQIACGSLGISPEQTAYVGDDLPDLAAIMQCRLGITVASAYTAVKDKADWVTENTGGEGAIREVADLLLVAKGKLETILASYC